MTADVSKDGTTPTAEKITKQDAELESDDEDTVMCTFDFSSPTEEDIPAIEKHLKEVFGRDADLMPISDLAKSVVAQGEVTQLILAVDEEDEEDDQKEKKAGDDERVVFGVLSVVPLKEFEQVKEYISKLAPEDKEFNERWVGLGDANVGLVLCSRTITIPAELVCSCYKLMSKSMLEADVKYDSYLNFSQLAVLPDSCSADCCTTGDECCAEEPEEECCKKEQADGDDEEVVANVILVHPEEEAFAAVGGSHIRASYVSPKAEEEKTEEEDEDENFDVEIQSFIILSTAEEFENAVNSFEDIEDLEDDLLEEDVATAAEGR